MSGSGLPRRGAPGASAPARRGRPRSRTAPRRGRRLRAGPRGTGRPGRTPRRAPGSGARAAASRQGRVGSPARPRPAAPRRGTLRSDRVRRGSPGTPATSRRRPAPRPRQGWPGAGRIPRRSRGNRNSHLDRSKKLLTSRQVPALGARCGGRGVGADGAESRRRRGVRHSAPGARFLTRAGSATPRDPGPEADNFPAPLGAGVTRPGGGTYGEGAGPDPAWNDPAWNSGPGTNDDARRSARARSGSAATSEQPSRVGWTKGGSPP